MPIGEIKSYKPDRGFGFIENGSEQNSDIFFHITQYEGKGEPPEEGQRVSFVANVGEKGLAASKVRKLDS